MLYFFWWTSGPVVYVVSMLPLTSRGTGSIPVWSTTRDNLTFARLFFVYVKNMLIYHDPHTTYFVIRAFSPTIPNPY